MQCHNTCHPHVHSLFGRLHPSHGPSLGGTLVYLTGEHFVDELQCNIATITVSATALSSSSLVCRTPPMSPGHVRIDVDVASASGLGMSSGLAFEFMLGSFSSIAPLNGPKNGFTMLSLQGLMFLPMSSTLACLFSNDVSVGASFDSTSHVSCVAPRSLDARMVTVHLVSDGVILPGHGTFSYSDIPVIMAINPTQGPRRGGTKITLTGTGTPLHCHACFQRLIVMHDVHFCPMRLVHADCLD